MKIILPKVFNVTLAVPKDGRVPIVGCPAIELSGKAHDDGCPAVNFKELWQKYCCKLGELNLRTNLFNQGY